MHFRLDSEVLPADGFSSTGVQIRFDGGEVEASDIRVIEGGRYIRLEGSRLYSTVLPGRAVIECRAPRAVPTRVTIVTRPVWTDRAGDGTPDFLRLDDPGDRAAFVDAFSAIAEAQYYHPRASLPTEISDCSALVRYAYRETFREHDAAWLVSQNLEAQPAKYRIPYTPMGPRLFRVSAGPLSVSDIDSGAFAEFADAEALRRWNTYPVSRDVRRADRGDLLFYRQPDQRSPWHAMVVVGTSHFHPADGSVVVYHTGHIGAEPGEVRRVSFAELLRHPQPRWRPEPGNPNFLGVYRWNILKQ